MYRIIGIFTLSCYLFIVAGIPEQEHPTNINYSNHNVAISRVIIYRCPHLFTSNPVLVHQNIFRCSVKYFDGFCTSQMLFLKPLIGKVSRGLWMGHNFYRVTPIPPRFMKMVLTKSWAQMHPESINISH